MNTQREFQPATKTCLQCGVELISKRSDAKYCTNACKDKAHYNLRHGFETLKRYNVEEKPDISQLFLKIIKGDLFKPSKTEILIDDFWSFCHASLWNTETFSESEITEFKKLIGEYFKFSINPEAKFKELVERVCLVKRYLSRRSTRYVSKPIDWLNIRYKNGLAGTRIWFLKVEQQRATVPHYNEGVSLLAQAILKYSDSRNILDMLYYRRELIKLKQTDLLQIYMNAIMHIQYFSF